MTGISERYLFRGKRIDTGEWVQGQLTGFVIAECSKGAWIDGVLSCLAYEVDPDTRGQCTGLRDKNGALIFEGDIVGINDFKIVIKWNKSTSSFYGHDVKRDKTSDHLAYFNCYEIIGNIHENPELLNGGDGE